MALTRLSTPVSGTTLDPTIHYINEFDHIYENGLALISPLTGTLNADSNQITNHRLENLAATPSAAAAGRLVFLTVGKQLALDDGAQIRFVPAMYGLTAGDLPIATSSSQYGKVSIGTTGQVLQVSGGLPAWTSSPSLTLVSAPTITTTTLNATAVLASTITTTTLSATTVGATTMYTTGSLTVGTGGTGISRIKSATGSCVWPAHNAAATISTTITVTGATTANAQDIVIVTHSAVTAASVLMSGYVSALDTVTVTLYNGTGAVYNPGAGTLRVTLLSHS